MMMYSVQLFFIFLLLHSIAAAQKKTSLRQRFQQLFQPAPVDYDNRYVWFTRNIDEEHPNLENVHPNHFKQFFVRKQSTV